MKITKAVIPAAGFGTRVLPATKNIPKEMFPIVDKPAIQYLVEECAAAGTEATAGACAPQPPQNFPSFCLPHWGQTHWAEAAATAASLPGATGA